MRTYDINIIAQSRDAFTSVEVTQFLEREMTERGFQLISQRCEAQQGASSFGPGHSEAHQKQIDLLTQLEKAQAALDTLKAYVGDYDNWHALPITDRQMELELDKGPAVLVAELTHILKFGHRYIDGEEDGRHYCFYITGWPSGTPRPGVVPYICGEALDA